MYQNRTLEQKVSFTKRVIWELRGNKELFIREKGAYSSTEVGVPLDQINCNYVYIEEKPVKWAVLTVTVAIAAITVAFGAGLQDKDPNILALFVGVFVFGLVLGIRKILSENKNLLVFSSTVTGNRLFALVRDDPSEQAVDEFVEELKQRVESFRTPGNISQADLPLLYEKQLAYLLGEGVLLQKEYEAAMKRLNDRKLAGKLFTIIR